MDYLRLMYNYFFHTSIIKTFLMLKLHVNTVSKNFSHIEDSILVMEMDGIRISKIGGCRENRWSDETYYGSDFIVFGDRCQEDGKFFIEIIQNCRMEIFYEVISRRVHLGTVFVTDGHLSYRNLSSNLPSICVMRYVVINSQKNYTCVHVFITNHVESLWGLLKKYFLNPVNAQHLEKKILIFSFGMGTCMIIMVKWTNFWN